MSDRRVLTTIGLLIGVWVVLVLGGAVLFANRVRQVGGLAGVLQPAVKGRPLACGPDAPIAAELEPLWIGYYSKNLQGAYDRVGKHDPRWDKPAAELMAGMAKLTAYAQGAPTFGNLLPVARALQKTGCDDPLIQSLVGDVLLQTDHRQEAEPLVSGSLAGLQARHYPPLCLAWAYLDMARLHGESGKSLERSDFKWRPLAISAYVQAAGEKFGPQEQRPLWWEISGLMEDEFRRSQAVIVMTLKSRPETDPWILNMAWGKHRYDFAWITRGGDFAARIPPEKYKAFEKLIGQAKQYFEKAYALQPQYPEAPKMMLGVVTDFGGASATARDWFDKTVTAQFDYMPAYYSMLRTLLPRWGGSHAALLAFGQECLDTGRFDTQVPKLYYEAVLTISETDRRNDIWQDPQIWPQLQKWCEGAVANVQKNKPKDLKSARTVYALIAYRCGHPEVARRQIEATGGAIDRPTFDMQWTERAELAVGKIFAQTGPRRERYAQAEQLYEQERIPEALTAFDALLKDETEKQAQFYACDRSQSLQWEKQFQAGGWVNLDPTPDGVGWDIFQGKYTPLADGKGFGMLPGDTFGIMACMMRPGRWFEIRCDLEFPQKQFKGIEGGFIVDIPMVASPYYDTFRIIRQPAEGICGGGWEQWQQHALTEVPQKCRVRLVQCDDRITVYLNDETVFQDQHLSAREFRVKGSHYVGIGGEVWPNPTEPVIYRNIQIHKMSTDPIKAPTPEQ